MAQRLTGVTSGGPHGGSSGLPRPPLTTSRGPGLPCVALSELKLNSSLVTYLRRCEESEPGRSASEAVESPSGLSYRPWSIERRLSEADVQTIITDFLAGTPQHVLADRYSVSLSGLKSLLRQRGIRRRPRPGSSP